LRADVFGYDRVCWTTRTTPTEWAILQSGSLPVIEPTEARPHETASSSSILDSQAQIDEAIRVAKAVNGVHSIHHELKIKK